MTKEEVDAAIVALEGSISSLDTWLWIATAIVAIGVIGEVIFGVRHLMLDNSLRELRRVETQIHEEELAQLTKDTADANARAQEAELALTKFRAPRLPTQTELAALTEKIKPFAGTKFDVGHPRVDREVWDFLWRLEPAIAAAGWVQIDWIGGAVFKKNAWPGDPWYGEMGVNNVSIEVRPESRAKLMPAAEALSAALEAIGIKATTGDNNNSSQNDDAIHLIVGPKR